MLPAKFGVSWPFGSAEEAKNSFFRWQPWRPSWISDQNEFSYFDPQVTPMLPIKFHTISLKKQKIDFQDDSHPGFPIEF